MLPPRIRRRDGEAVEEHLGLLGAVPPERWPEWLTQVPGRATLGFVERCIQRARGLAYAEPAAAARFRRLAARALRRAPVGPPDWPHHDALRLLILLTRLRLRMTAEGQVEVGHGLRRVRLCLEVAGGPAVLWSEYWLLAAWACLRGGELAVAARYLAHAAAIAQRARLGWGLMPCGLLQLVLGREREVSRWSRDFLVHYLADVQPPLDALRRLVAAGERQAAFEWIIRRQGEWETRSGVFREPPTGPEPGSAEVTR